MEATKRAIVGVDSDNPDLIGKIITAPIVRAALDGIYLAIAGFDSAVVTTKLLGTQAERQAFCGALKPGDSFTARVVKHISTSRQLVLEPLCAPSTWGCGASPSVRTRKPPYTLLPAGTLVLFDLANLLCDLKPQDAPTVLTIIRDHLLIQGLKPIWFLEKRKLDELYKVQATPSTADALRRFVRLNDVSLIPGKAEADLAILQALRVFPDAVGLSNDKFRDYAEVFAEIVDTPRIRNFSLAKIEGKYLLTITGLANAITIPADAVKATACASPAAESPQEVVLPAPHSEEAFEDVFVESVPWQVLPKPPPFNAPRAKSSLAIINRGKALISRGRTQEGIACFEKAGKQADDPRGYEALDELASSQEIPFPETLDSTDYAALAIRLSKKRHEKKVRAKRRLAESRRMKVHAHRFAS